ncbi:MAG: hypothetical protein AMXMBFR84_14650 [Candidatus Hydrogenedentota bacterium]
MIWVEAILLAVVTGFSAVCLWNVFAWARIPLGAHATFQSVSILIPARNESANIGSCLEHTRYLGQGVLEVLVYDDHSNDDTAKLVREAGEFDTRIRLIATADLPSDWCGKPFACHQLAAAAKGDWLLFIDADARLQPGAVDALVSEACARNASMVSAWPRLKMGSAWEWALMPFLNFCVFSVFPAPLSLKRKEPSLGIAHGACILAHRETYHRIGGHAMVRSEVFEDTVLARRWREHGEFGVCLDGQDVVHVRMYNSFASIWSGFQKVVYPAFRRDSSFWIFTLLHAAVFLGPFIYIPIDLFTDRLEWPIWTAALVTLAARSALAVRFCQGWITVVLHPVVECLFVALCFSSRHRYLHGEGVSWKGRMYRPREPRQSKPAATSGAQL